MRGNQLLLDYVYKNEAQYANKIWFTQPVGGGQVKEYTWSEAVGEARCMAAHLRSLNLEPGSKIALISKNCAHFMIAELSIWMAGHTSVALYPTVNAETASYILDHSDSQLVFVGKLDTWDEIAPGVPESLPRIALPLAPAGADAVQPASWRDKEGGRK